MSVKSTVALVVFVIAVSGVGTPAAFGQGECSNELIRGLQTIVPQLPDCRSYEQVTPVDKNATDALGASGLVQSSLSGNGVTFFSILPFPGVAGAADFLTYLSTRADGLWLTQGLLPKSGPGSSTGVLGLVGNLTETVLEANQEPLLASGATPGQVNYYVRDNETGSFHLLAPGPGGKFFPADSTPDGSRILFEDKAKLTEDANAGVINLYEWNNESKHISLVGIVEGKAPEAVAGAGGPAAEEPEPKEFYAEHTISEDGSRIFFTDVSTGKIYVRENGTTTIQVSGSLPAHWRAATPDGRYVFYTEGEELWRFEVESKTREAIGSAIGIVGVSDDGSYVYFVNGSSDLYVWHEGATVNPTFIAGPLNASRDRSDWRDFFANEPGGPAQGGKSSRVSPDGKTMLFASIAHITNYNNAEEIELYLYDAERPVSSDNPVCISCNPRVGSAISNAYLARKTSTAAPSTGPNTYLPRNLSADGSRAFFQTEEALVPQDTNSQMDVYEWEREGHGSCDPTSGSFSESADGCLYLISTGQSNTASSFGDASLSGSDVFFFTRQALVGQDQDFNADLYDAREDGGIASQNPPVPAPPCASEVLCLGAPASSPAFGIPTSATLSMGGNLIPPVAPKPPAKPGAKPLTKGQKLSKALKACRRKPKKKRAACEAQVRKRYRGTSKARKAVRFVTILPTKATRRRPS